MSIATGGPLLPSPAPAPLSGPELQTFLQNWISPISGLQGKFVRPRWQTEPSNIPDEGIAWAAIGFVGDEDSDMFPYVAQSADGLTSTLQRNEELTLLCSFYDTGVSGQADYLSRLLRDNLAIAQNWEPLLSQGFALAYVRPRVNVPTMLSKKWLYRVDLPVVVRCQFQRKYEVLSVLSMNGTVYTDVGYDFKVSANSGE